MTEKLEAQPFLSKRGRTHKCYIFNTDKRILNEIEYTEKTEVPRELIKFYSVSENSVNALRNGYLWATNPSDFNDPFDCPIQLWDISSFANNSHSRKIFYEGRLATLGIICLNEFSLKDQDVLWGYYTNQQGFAIKLDSIQLQKDFGIPFKIQYLEPDEFDHFDINQINVVIDLFPMFLRWSTQKKPIWKNENEWRFIFSNLEADSLLGDAPKEERSKKYNSSAIEEVILGLKFFHQTNMVEVSKHDSYYIIQGEQHKIQNELLEFLSFPSEIPVKHMYMKVDELIMTPRPCQIFNLNNGRFKIHYLLASEEEYKLALKRLEVIFDAPIGTPESDEANELALLIDEFEQAHYPIDSK